MNDDSLAQGVLAHRNSGEHDGPYLRWGAAKAATRCSRTSLGQDPGGCAQEILG